MNPEHLRALAVLAAMGNGPTEIARKLEEGVRTPRLGQLPPVSVTPSSISKRLKSCDETRALLREARHRLFGDVYDSPLAYAGTRMQKLELALEQLEAQLAANRKDRGKDGKRAASTVRQEERRILGEIRGVITEAGKLAEACDPGREIEVSRTMPTGPGGAVTVRARGNAAKAVYGDLARDLAAMQAAGIVEVDADQEPEPEPEPDEDD